jgi:DNA polymerase elongation subunit (family B)
MLVDKIDKQTGLMDLALIIAIKGGVNYMDTFGTTAIWDYIIYRYLHERKIAVPPSLYKPKSDYSGGYVKDPVVGMTKWVTSFDLNSLYPNLIVQYNMSPETLLSGPGDFTASCVDYYLLNDIDPELRSRDVAVAACNGQPYSPRRVRWGFRKMIPAIVPYLAPSSLPYP